MLNLSEGSEYVTSLKYVRVQYICKFSQMWQGSENTLGCNYGRVLNIPGFQICQLSAYANVAQRSEYARI